MVRARQDETQACSTGNERSEEKWLNKDAVIDQQTLLLIISSEVTTKNKPGTQKYPPRVQFHQENYDLAHENRGK